ncbi:MAG: hypothetical protein UW81_C0011G0010 [Candidatus Giovannonibacteria bacterium GW2011_GWC2_44_9]|uniref:Uncharacterized protein n=3 Tax=Candidatus Giovannoniibacteriota TaxID=1752738 RepID=A0A0G1LSN1_9BACT|nr:MAG: hypothetical protein UW49_C0018G0015 [Candidatus Giovannonibacteria bacterium GW2011_GWB1_44_23]KKT62759.1 MAG: hypothetical protein UW57_C0013G0016 [Candidatus Giovannonibacteria bacterium GW2011_GWA1_44_29]KKT83779.1 MAG: hypothetical protein UW81_C0011G0010 [Candidatus Giovannonibacteria bacterium GW2011_GWC2_44_9]KKT91033.1 MAG: hypothetical protein UW93_C0014G0016 [Parcubacteria group bacterium GW2011_GWC1_45_13]
MYKEAKHYEGGEERRGKLSEHFLLGSLNTETKMYLPYREAVKLAKDIQQDNPASPKKPFMRDLRDAIVHKMDFKNAKNAERLKIYTAVGTPLDHFHKADMFVELEDEDGKNSKIATGDATINKEKISDKDKKADVLIGEIPDPTENKEEYNFAVAELAEKFTAVLKAKLSFGGRA